MKTVIIILTVLLMALATSCGSVTPTYHYDAGENYGRIFGERVPRGVDVVNSILATYPFRVGVVTTPDWEIELLAPKSWIEDTTKDMHLAPGGERSIELRKAQGVSPWYAPLPTDSYDCFYLAATSIPYVQMLVLKESEEDGRHRVFLSKH